ncbi:alpha-(1-_3)-arabinofuranosyltransferase [soil metagenome]
MTGATAGRLIAQRVGSGRTITRRTNRLTYALFAAIAYLPALLTKPGRMPADTKLYLYLNPGRLIADAPYTWDTRQFGGWVPHQTISYLWPQGPWYWFFDKLGAPDWVAHRLWIGSLLVLGAMGVYWAARLLGMTKVSAVVAAVLYQLSPYTLPYLSRTSAMLLPWAALGWLVGLTILAATSDRRWRHPALIALVLVTCSAVNATAVLMIAPAPILWLLHATVQRTITWQRTLAVVVRVGGLAAAVSLWWIAMLRTQGTYGADVLAYSETLQATSLTSVSTEVFRGMGYWLMYVRDAYASTTTAAVAYMESPALIAISFALPLFGVAGIALTRWTQQRYAALLVFVGVVLAVGVHPIADASPLMSPLAENSRSSLALALRSSARAVPLSSFGLALGAGALVAALGSTRLRWRAFAPVIVVLIAIANLPALFDGGLVDPALERSESPPAAWIEAADALSASSSEFRVLELPGAEFGAFRWGYTVDPPLPGLTTKPLVTRDLLPLGSPGVMDLLYALDDRVQEHTLDPHSIAIVSRFLAADTIWLANDIAFDRFRNPRPEEIAALFARQPEGLGRPVAYGPPVPNDPDVPMVDETTLSNPAIGTPLSPVSLVAVKDAVSILRASSRVVVLVGSGDGVVDAAAAGLLRGDEALFYAADFADLAGNSSPDSLHVAAVIISDSNRDRAHHWRGSQDVTGFTESGGPASDVLRIDEADQRLPVFGPLSVADDQTIAFLDDGLQVRASGYGEPFAYRPEQRPAMAVDGNPLTAWVVGDHGDPVGNFFTVSQTAGALQLLQPQDLSADRMITSVHITGANGWSTDVALDDSSLTGAGQTIDVPTDIALTITITGVGQRIAGTEGGLSGVGFAEIGIGAHPEIVRLPITSVAGDDAPTAVVLTRLRVDPRNRWRSDPEPTLEREFTVASAHAFGVSVQLRRDDRASDATLDALDQVTGATADRRLVGVPSARGRFAADGDPETAWTSPFGDVVGSMLTVPLDGTPLGEIKLQQTVDSEHSLITATRISANDVDFDIAVPAPDASGTSNLKLPAAITANELTLAVTAISPNTTLDRRFGDQVVLPVSIRELTAPAIAQPTTVDGSAANMCDNTLVAVDGTPLPLRITAADRLALAAGETVTVAACAPLTVTVGPHRVSTADGLLTGTDVNQIVLDDGVAAVAETAPANPIVTVERTRTTRTAVANCPAGCWLIMGEGYNTGWEASIGGKSLGETRQIAGGFNGWWLPASSTPTTVHIAWQAQDTVDYALIASAFAVICCIFLAVASRRTRAVNSALPGLPARFERGLLRPVTRRAAVMTAGFLVALTWLVVPTPIAIVVLLPAVAVVWLRRPFVAGVAAVLLLGAISGAVTVGQLVYAFAAHGGWPTNWDRVHGLGLMVTTLLLAATIVDRSDRPVDCSGVEGSKH